MCHVAPAPPRTVWPVVTVLSSLLLVYPAHAEPAPLPTAVVSRDDGRLYAGDGWLDRRGPVPVVHFKGTHRQIGAQHYLLLAREAESLRAVFDPSAQPHEGWDRVVWAFREAYMRLKIAPSLLRHTPPELVAEMEGFVAAASGGKDRDLLPVLFGSAFQDVQLVYGCTSLAVFGPHSADGRLLHGRNLDALSLQELGRYGVVAIYEPEGAYPFITLTYPANVGVMHGMNLHGITVSMNYSFATPSNVTTDGIAFPFLLRHVLERATTLDEAVEMIRTAPRTVGLNILVADGKIPDARVIEVAADRFQVRRPQDGAIWATNRYETAYMQEIQRPGWLASQARDARLRDMLAGAGGRLDVAGMAAVLRDRGDPGSPEWRSLVGGINNAGTLASLIFDPSRLQMWVGIVGDAGTAADGPFHAFDLAQELQDDGRGAAGPGDMVPVDGATAGLASDRAAWQAMWKAEYLHSVGRHDDVRRLLEPVVATFPQAERALVLLGRSYLHLGTSDKAAVCFQNVLDLPVIVEPRSRVEAEYWLGRIAEARGRGDAAAQAYARALMVSLPDTAGDEDAYQREARRRLARLRPGEAPSAPPQAPPSPDLGGRFAGRPIDAVTVVGRATAPATVVESRLALREGKVLTSDALQLTSARLLQTGAFESVTLTPVPAGDLASGVDVVVRLHEGFGWYRDPVELAIVTAARLALSNELHVAYANIAGTGINAEATYRLSGGTMPAYRLAVEAPSPPALARWAPPFMGRLSWQQGSSLVRDTEGGQGELTRTVAVRQAGLSAETIWTPRLTTLTGLAWRDEAWSDTAGGTQPAAEGRGQMVAGSVQADWAALDSRSWPHRGWTLGAGLLYTVPSTWESRAPADPPAAYPFGRVEARSAVYTPLDGARRWVAGAALAAGWADTETPFHRRFIPGPATGLRIAGPALASRQYAAVAVEVTQEVIPSLRIGLFYEWGSFGERALFGPSAVTGTTGVAQGGGVTVRYLTPVGTRVDGFIGRTVGGQLTWGVSL